MSDAKSPPDWSKDWQALQKQYWNAWTDVTKNATATPDAATPWHEGLEQWSRLFGNAGKQSDAAERMLASAKGYIALMQSMLGAAGQGAATGGTAHAWTEAMRNGFNMPGLDANFFDNPLAKAMRDISGQGVKGFEQLASGGPWLQKMQQEGLSWLQAPAFGYAREHQEHYQKMALAFVEYQEAMKQYNDLILKSSKRGFDIFEDKLAERSEPGRQLDSIRAVYDLWVDAAEEAYAEIALTDEFRKVYGDVVNAQMRVRSQMQQEVERIGVDLGMPTRTELNSVHKRLHDLRRELRDEKEGAEGGVSNDERDAKIAALRDEVEALKRQLGKSKTEPAAPAAARPRASKRAAPRAARAAAPKPEASRREPKASASFGEAIAAIRETAAPKSKKKSAKAVASPPSRVARSGDKS